MLEKIVTELILNSGNARNFALEAIQYAEQHEFDLASKKLKECDESLALAHKFHSGLLFDEANGSKKVELNMILVHGQDHLMNAITVRDLAEHMIKMCKIMFDKFENMEE